jgi:hypothetical protein
MSDFKLKNKTRCGDRGEIKQPPDPAKTARSLLPGRAMNAPFVSILHELCEFIRESGR